MVFFSVSLFKKCLDKKFLVPSFFIIFIALALWDIFDLLIPNEAIGRFFWAESLIFSFGLVCLSLLSILMKKKNDEKIEFSTLIDCFQQLSSLALCSVIAGAFFLFSGMLLQFLQRLPFLGYFFKVIFCLINFAFYLLEPVIFIAIIAGLFCLGKMIFSGKKIIFYSFYEEIKASKGHETLLALSILKASLPLVILGGFLFLNVEKVICEEKIILQFLIRLILSIPISLLLAPFVNYFFFFSFAAGEKNKVERQNTAYSKASR